MSLDQSLELVLHSLQTITRNLTQQWHLEISITIYLHGL